jgi:hypothetical protein
MDWHGHNKWVCRLIERRLQLAEVCLNKIAELLRLFLIRSLTSTTIESSSTSTTLQQQVQSCPKHQYYQFLRLLLPIKKTVILPLLCRLSPTVHLLSTKTTVNNIQGRHPRRRK